MLTVLNGGKDVGSKIKFSKFYLILNFKPEDSDKFDINEVYLQIVANLDKNIAATKGGAALFKKGASGALFNAYENINECFKLLEDVIAAVDINTEENKYLKIGINVDAKNWHLDDIKKYDWDGKV